MVASPFCDLCGRVEGVFAAMPGEQNTAAQAEFFKALLGTLENSMRQTQKSLLERMDRSEQNLHESFTQAKTYIAVLPREFANLDKQMAIMSERQNKVFDLESLVKSQGDRLKVLEDDHQHTVGALRFLKWAISIGGGGGLLAAFVNWLQHGGGQ